jgi:hypothetical protein
MDFSLTTTQRDIRKAAREFATIAQECDEKESFNLELLKKVLNWGS